MKVVFFTGAGISAESGVATFRDSDGLWENYHVEDVASIQGWYRNPKLVLDFYNLRRSQMSEVTYNDAHKYLADLENIPDIDVKIITQNVDDLHERAGSTNVLHLHGRLDEACSSNNKSVGITKINSDINIGDLAEDGSQLRPNIVWFGEYVDMENATKLVNDADIFIVIGTSLQVYPAASLLEYVNNTCKVIVIDPSDMDLDSSILHIQEKATNGVLMLNKYLC